MRSGGGRIIGVDVARGLAIIGMFVAHTIPRPDESELLVDGRSSVLFATLAGVSLGLMSGAGSPLARGNRAAFVLGVVVRAVCLFLLGGILASLNSGVVVILDYYAFMFLMLVPALFLPRWAMALLAVALAVAAPALAAGVGEADADAAPAQHLLQYYLLDGTYPALVWMPFLLTGLAAARSGLTRGRTQVFMMVAGTAAAIVGYGAARAVPGITAEAHSSTTAEVFGSGGVAIAVIGALLWATSMRRGAAGRAALAVAWPVGALGAMALTVYTVQIISLAIVVAVDEGGGAIEYPGWPLLIWLTLASLVLAAAWRWWFGSGPLERLFSFLAQLPRRRWQAGARDSRAQLPGR
ncbi:hypothetical protein [Glaciibacter sp. 2TAF33]|uniref:hypothetical protein n=1 Tax=Glaciibacter sp. 2TAF33 TaxID=3233015 RepID=UPI003F8F595E